VEILFDLYELLDVLHWLKSVTAIYRGNNFMVGLLNSGWPHWLYRLQPWKPRLKYII